MKLIPFICFTYCLWILNLSALYSIHLSCLVPPPRLRQFRMLILLILLWTLALRKKSTTKEYNVIVSFNMIREISKISVFFKFYMYRICLNICLCTTCVPSVKSLKARKWCQCPWKWSCRELWAIMWYFNRIRSHLSVPQAKNKITHFGKKI